MARFRCVALEDDGVESAEVSTSKHHLNIPFVLSIIQTFAQRDCTVHVAPVSAVRHAAHWYKPGVWCVMTNPSRMALLSSMVQLHGMVRSGEGHFEHVTGLTFVKLYSFTFEQLNVVQTPTTISFDLPHLVHALDYLPEKCSDALSTHTDQFPCPEVEPLCHSCYWVWSAYSFLELVTDESMAFQPLHYIGTASAPVQVPETTLRNRTLLTYVHGLGSDVGAAAGWTQTGDEVQHA